MVSPEHASSLSILHGLQYLATEGFPGATWSPPINVRAAFDDLGRFERWECWIGRHHVRFAGVHVHAKRFITSSGRRGRLIGSLAYYIIYFGGLGPLDRSQR